MNPHPGQAQQPPKPKPIQTAGWSPKKLCAELDKWVIGQDRAKRVISLAVWNHILRCNEALKGGGVTDIKKSNVLIIGPTGTGKTHIARTIAKVLGLPIIIADATEYTEAGYYGKDVEVMVAELLHACDMDVSLCERGIIFIDEMDKVARKNGGNRTGAGNRDIGGEGVQQSILKLLEGRKMFVPNNVTQHWNKHDFVEIDTSNILFICAGTFTDVREEIPAGGLGFGVDVERGKKTRRISHKQLTDAGMISELLGRIPVIVQLDFLEAPDLAQILTDPPDALVKEYKRLMEIQGVTLDFTPEAIQAVAAFAYKRKVGARGLRAVMEEVMHDLMFDAVDLEVKTVKVEPSLVEEKLKGFDSGMLGD